MTADTEVKPLTALQAQYALDGCQGDNPDPSPQVQEALEAIADGHHLVIDTATHEAVERGELERLRADARRLDALEKLANQPGGVLLHDGSETGRTGLGLRPGRLVRSLRDAIDAAQQEQSNDR